MHRPYQRRSMRTRAPPQHATARPDVQHVRGRLLLSASAWGPPRVWLQVDGPSMEPTFEAEGDLVITVPILPDWVPWSGGPVKPGDCVIAYKPSSETMRFLIVKRVRPPFFPPCLRCRWCHLKRVQAAVHSSPYAPSSFITLAGSMMPSQAPSAAPSQAPSSAPSAAPSLPTATAQSNPPQGWPPRAW